MGAVARLTLESAAKYLKRPYCMTGHATQGLSLGARIYVHDWNTHMATHRWIRTVMSRCGTLDIILVKGSEGVRGRQTDINVRVASHKLADRKNEFTWDDEQYITTEWVKKQLKKQRWSCYSCGDLLDADWSVDRVSNDLPHLMDNCALLCRRCQHASSHRPTCAKMPAYKPEPLTEHEVHLLRIFENPLYCNHEHCDGCAHYQYHASGCQPCLTCQGTATDYYDTYRSYGVYAPGTPVTDPSILHQF